MNILLGSHGFPPNQTGGAEWRTYRTARWLSERGHGVHVLAVDDTKYRGNQVRISEESVDGFKVQRLSFNLDLSMKPQAEFNNPIVYQTLSDIFARDNIDIFHLISGYRMSGSAIQSAWDAQIPILVSLTDFWFLCHRITLQRTTGELCRVPQDPVECTLCIQNQKRRYSFLHRISNGRTEGLLKRFWKKTNFVGAENIRRTNELIRSRRRFLNQSLKKVNKLISPSKFLADLFKAQGVTNEQIVLLRQGVNIEQIPRNPNYHPSKPLTFGYIGQFAAHKGVDILVKSFKKLPHSQKEIKLIIYGNPKNAWPPFLKKLEQEVSGDPRIILGGYFKNTDARKVYNELDAVIVPSIWFENSPNVILEAFACGTPVLASDLGGMAELVEHNVNGFLFKPNNMRSLENALLQIITDPNQLTYWRKNIPQVKSVDDEMVELEAIYTRVIVHRFNPTSSPSEASNHR